MRTKKNTVIILVAIAVVVVCVAFLAKSGNKKDSTTEAKSDTEDISTSTEEPFYGIWTSASKDSKQAKEDASEFEEKGFDCSVILTSDWENLNQEDWYALTIGKYSTKENAEEHLKDVKEVYPDAYIKYSGQYKQ